MRRGMVLKTTEARIRRKCGWVTFTVGTLPGSVRKLRASGRLCEQPTAKGVALDERRSQQQHKEAVFAFFLDSI